MWQDPLIAALDIALSFVIWPMVWRIYKTKNVQSQTLWTSVPTAIMVAMVGWLFWSRGMVLVSVAHLPSAIGWALVAGLTIYYSNFNRHMTALD